MYFRAASLEGHSRKDTWPCVSPPASPLRGQGTKPSGGSWSLKASTRPGGCSCPLSLSLQSKGRSIRAGTVPQVTVCSCGGVESLSGYKKTRSHEVQRLPCTSLFTQLSAISPIFWDAQLMGLTVLWQLTITALLIIPSQHQLKRFS